MTPGRVINGATRPCCIEEQHKAERSYLYASQYRERDQIDIASNEQREAARHYGQMWMRLAQLIGAAP